MRARANPSSDLGPNIRPTPYGWQAYVTVHGVTYFKRFKAVRGEPPLRAMREWINLTRGEKMTSTSPWAPHPKGRRGEFESDARHRYLPAVKAMPTYRERKTHIEEWIAIFGRTRRNRITAADIQAALHRMRTEPRSVQIGKRTESRVLSASAVNKRRTALMHLFTVLDRNSAPNPVRDVPKFREPTPLPRGVSLTTLEKILAKMPKGKHYARALVMTHTGIPHALLKRITERDVDWRARTVWVSARRKGQGVPARLVPLSAQGAQAFRVMRHFKAFGSFNNSRFCKMWHTARRAAKVAAHIRPYDLRHSFGSYAYARTGDLHAVQELLGHSSPLLTARYAMAAVPARLRAAVEAINQG